MYLYAMMTPMKRTMVFLPGLERTNGRGKRRVGGSDPLAKVEGIVHDGKLSAGIDEALYGN